jgi:hypothetical protein
MDVSLEQVQVVYGDPDVTPRGEREDSQSATMAEGVPLPVDVDSTSEPSVKGVVA